MVYIVIAVLHGVLSIWILQYIIAFRKIITNMAGMMAAMTLGMTVGLGMGALLAMWLPGQFFHSTLFAILIGGGIGMLAGASISVMAVIDGLLSGLMGGMMGTMLMLMMPVSYTGHTVKLLSILCYSIVFILFIMLRGEVHSSGGTRASGLHLKPGMMFLMITISSGFILLGSSTNPHSHGSPTHSHSSVTEQPVVIVHASEYSFTPSSIQVKAGQTIKILFENMGEVEHHFEVVGQNIQIRSEPGENNYQLIKLDKAGYYQVICSLPGHKEAGMVGSIQVTES